MTDKPLYTTLQPVFDKAWFGLKAQGFNQALNFGGCVYRGDGGMKCAIGHAIPDELYAAGMESCAPGDDEFEAIFAEDLSDYLLHLQNCHDQSREPSLMEQRLREFAADYNLTIPA